MQRPDDQVHDCGGVHLVGGGCVGVESMSRLELFGTLSVGVVVEVLFFETVSHEAVARDG